IFSAGEPTGIGGVELAIIEGQIAGLSATDQHQKAARLLHARRRHRRFAATLENAFALRSELRELPKDDTLICRCEDVAFCALARCESWRQAKLYTRCGMGPCQGRICGTATQFLFGWNPESIRPPILSARVESLASTYQDPTDIAMTLSSAPLERQPS